MAASQKIKLGLLQTWADADPVSNLKRTLRLAHAAADQGAQIISTQELFRSPYFCQSEDHANFALAEEIPNGPSTQAFCELAKSRGVVIVASLFEKRDGGRLSQHRRDHRRRRHLSRHVPQDAHSRRPALLREVLFHAGRSRFSRLEHALRPHRRAHLLGPMVSRGRAAHRDARRANSLLSDRHRLASERAGKIRRGASLLVGNDPARARRGQRLLRRRDEPRRPRNAPSAATASSSGARVSSPNTSGQIIAKAGLEKEEILVHEIDLATVDVTRTHWPFLRDRRIDAYGDLTRRLVD